MRHDDTRDRPEAGADTDGQRGAAPPDAVLRRIGSALQGLRYGSVLVIVQDGVVVQIERTEKTRLTR